MTVITGNSAHCLIVRSTMINIDMRRIGRRAEEGFEDTKEVIRIRISKKNRQHNGQKKKYKNQANNQW